MTRIPSYQCRLRIERSSKIFASSCMRCFTGRILKSTSLKLRPLYQMEECKLAFPTSPETHLSQVQNRVSHKFRAEFLTSSDPRLSQVQSCVQSCVSLTSTELCFSQQFRAASSQQLRAAFLSTDRSRLLYKSGLCLPYNSVLSEFSLYKS